MDTGGAAASTGAPSRPAYWHRGIGYDYAFADVVGENVVRKALALGHHFEYCCPSRTFPVFMCSCLINARVLAVDATAK